MSRRITMIGLAALCALALAAVAAASASAAVETTAWTCLEGASGGKGTKFSDADCSVESTTGAFGHKEIPLNEETQLTLKKVNNPVLKFTAGTATVTLEGTGAVECLECMAHNAGTAEAMEVTGTGGRLVFKGVIVKGKETQCEVNNGKTITTKPLVFHTTATNEAKIEPVTPPVLAEFEINEIAATCAFKGPFTVKGDANGITSGAFLTVNVPKASSTLTVGALGAELTGKATMEAGVTNPKSESEHHPVALT